MAVSSFLPLLGIIVCLVLSAFFSGSETALFSVDRIQRKRMVLTRGRRGSSVARLLENPRRLLISILICNMFVNILSSSLAETACSRMWGESGLWISIIGMSALILVFGEITPKIIAIRNSERISLVVAPAIDFLARMVFPLRKALRFVADSIVIVLGKWIRRGEAHLTEAELRTAVKFSRRQGILDAEESEMIYSVFGLGEKCAGEIMIPRTEMVCFGIDQTAEEMSRVIGKKGFSRYPVYEGKQDNVIGILYAKDFLIARERDAVDTASLRGLLRKPYYIPETKNAGMLLNELRKAKIHIAVVVDEYGGTAGIVTLEDVLEEIFGEIEDQSTPLFRKINPTTVVVDGKMEMEDFNKLLNVELSDDESHTIGGWIMKLTGKVPAMGDNFHYGELFFHVVAATRTKVKEVMVRKVRSTGRKQG